MKRVLMEHYSHPMHPLFRVTEDKSFSCLACLQSGSGTRYRCDYCNLDLHTFCATCPRTILSPLHAGHKLTLSGGYWCHVCLSELKQCSLVYGCETCNFYVHPACLPNTDFHNSPPNNLTINYRGDSCSLELLNAKGNYTCQGCKMQIAESKIYYSSSHGFKFHWKCATCPKTLRSSLHEEHPLTIGSWRIDSKCNDCCEVVKKSFYTCNDCDIVLHPICVHKSSASEIGGSSVAEEAAEKKAIYFFMHPAHYLSLAQHPKDPCCCEACREPIEGDCYSCAECRFAVHKMCASLIKPAIIDKAHPGHTLYYQQHRRSPCAVCKEHCVQWRYYCGLCNVHLHKDCLGGAIDGGASCGLSSLAISSSVDEN